MKGTWVIRADRDFEWNGIVVGMHVEYPDGTRGDVQPLNFVTRTPGEVSKPVFVPPDGEAFLRAALNAAWEIGLRPDGFHDTRESMKATNAHLQDMRALAFHKTGAMKP